MLGRHYCPACGKAAGFRYEEDKTKVRWYRPAHARLSCNACGVEVRGRFRRAIWAALPIWVLLGGGSVVGLVEYGVLGNGAAQIAAVLVFAVVGACIVQVFLQYEVARHAP